VAYRHGLVKPSGDPNTSAVIRLLLVQALGQVERQQGQQGQQVAT
jgi:hypothetical protein